MDGNMNGTLAAFWNQAIALTPEEKEELRLNKTPLEELAPSEKLFLAAKSLGESQRVLDYGCGNGWASIIALSSGCPSVIAVDLGPDIIDAAKFGASLYAVEDRLEAFVVDPDWLEKVPSESFDGIICSNVLDVIPTGTCMQILRNLSRVAKKDAKVFIGLNFHMSPEMASSRGIVLEEGKYLIQNGVLRLTSHSDEEWREIFLPYFDVVSLEHFAWPGESKETRRLFSLKKKE